MRFSDNADPLAPIWSSDDDDVQPRSSTRRGSGRGRDPSPKRTSLSSPTQVSFNQTFQSRVIEAHHHLPPPTTTSIPSDPILYLPPLLSPLPHQHKHEHEHEEEGKKEEELSGFATRLPDIDPASLALHQALHSFRPWDEGYAARSYDQAFNWKDLRLPKDISREWYCVVFRSRRNATSSSLSLYAADREAHEEAVSNGGLILYWYGVPDETGLNLATCIWQSRRHAVKAISGPKHLMAMKQAKDAYEIYELERWVLTKERGQNGLSLKKWEGGEVGW